MAVDSTQDITEPNADEITMLLSNLAKSDRLQNILVLKRAIPRPLSESAGAMNQLMDCFVKGAEGNLNKAANFDYLAYFFADITKVSPPKLSTQLDFLTPV